MLARCEKRHALFLQGLGGLYFYRLAQILSGLGVQTSKIHLCLGDQLFWRGKNSVSYREPFANWKDYLQKYILDNGVTDIVLFSDSRPYHAVAAALAKTMNVNVFVFENGYLRPDWITMEIGGVNGRSGFPRDTGEIIKLSAQTVSWTRTSAKEVPVRPLKLYFGDTVFHGVNFLTSFAFPGYSGFRKVSALTEAGGWIKKALTRRAKVRRSKAALADLLAGGEPFFFYPLQLEHDYQLKVDSPYNSISQASNEVIASFASHAPDQAKLLVKNHPLDNNVTDREAETARLARLHGVEDRVVFIEAGHNPTILDRTVGMITINSTMGTSALYHHVPMCVLGDAVYKIDGLVHSGRLDSFWKAPQQPDVEFCKVFRRALIAHCQVKGHYSQTNPDAWIYEHCVAKFFSASYRPPSKAVDMPVDQMKVASVPVNKTELVETGTVQTG